ncbi:MAG: hypothetical protein FLDDKLPJ_02997 [Phycisphaerae bacterium]|nr:hypothetical protein [Phycisphaerae bacterium]
MSRREVGDALGLRGSRLGAAALAVAGGALLTGCPAPPRNREVFDPLPLAQAVELINAPPARLTGLLRATGDVRARVRSATSDRIKQYDLEGVLLFVAPDHLHFDLRHELAGEQLSVGSNGVYYWYDDDPDYAPICRRYDEFPDGYDPELPIQPRQLVEALGLSGVPFGPDAHPLDQPVQRVEDADQQLLLLAYDAAGAPRLVKEYWISRVDRRALHRIVFRDAMGCVEMISELSEHRAADTGLPSLPYRIQINWPKDGSSLEFRIRRWEHRPELGRDLPAFTPPIFRDAAED